jgi:hypothetical protein
MNAADVIRDGTAEWSPAHTTASEAPGIVAALLAHGEQGVAILPDGTLRALEWRAHEGADGEVASLTELTLADITTGRVANPHWTTLYRLMPLSAEAGDQGTWMGGGLEITYPSAEAGDTDG